MAPWELEEIANCRTKVRRFRNAVTKELMKTLYNEIGGIPRYVLRIPTLELEKNSSLEDTKEAALNRINGALASLKSPVDLLNCINQTKESLDHSGCLLHRWPTEDHKKSNLRWGSEYIMLKVAEKADLEAVNEGGHNFEIKRLTPKTSRKTTATNNEPQSLEIPAGLDCIPVLETSDLSQLSSQPDGKTPLFKPLSLKFPCIDLAMAPNHLFQVTVSLSHPTKQVPFKEILEAILGNDWRESDNAINLYFVVPDYIYDSFGFQGYLNENKKTSKAVPEIITSSIRQYALKINTKAAYTGKSPGISPELNSLGQSSSSGNYQHSLESEDEQ
ncbi:hypothetical protein BGZ76_005033 [Entomortierella beljakovae]|nr:hypothetical protein BGZ76_005033 [Entomortierella beljakovae]